MSLVKYQQVVFGQTEKLKELNKSELEKKELINRLQVEINELKSRITTSVATEREETAASRQRLNDSEISSLRSNILLGIRDGLLVFSRERCG